MENKIVKIRNIVTEKTAIQWDGENNLLVDEFLEGQPKEVKYYWDKEDNLIIETLEGDMKANKGDWIIKGLSGEFYPCKSDIFEKSYEIIK